MTSEIVPIAAEKQTRNTNSRVRSRTIATLDRRTSAAKRVLEIETKLAEGLNAKRPWPERTWQLLRRAAMLGVMAENAEARMLAGEWPEESRYVEIVAAQQRTLDALLLADSAEG